MSVGERESEDLWQAGREKRGAMMLRMRQRLLAIRAKEPRDCGKKHVLAARGGEENVSSFFRPVRTTFGSAVLGPSLSPSTRWKGPWQVVNQREQPTGHGCRIFSC